MIDYNKRLERFKRLLPNEMKTTGFDLIDNYLHKSLKAQFNKKNNDALSSWKQPNLHKRSGALIDSYLTKSPYTASKVEYKNNKLETNFGSKLHYAFIHEKGGEIKARKINIFGKYAMAGFFWYKYKETKQKGYMYMALKVAKDGKIDMPARGYFSKAIANFESTTKDSFLKEKANRLLKLWENSK